MKKLLIAMLLLVPFVAITLSVSSAEDKGDEDEIYVRITTVESAKDSIDKVLELPVENSGNYLVPLKDIVIELSDWMIDVHQTLLRGRNTAYAHEGIIHAYELARRKNDNHSAARTQSRSRCLLQ